MTSDARKEIESRDRRLLSALEREQQQISSQPTQRAQTHRPYPVPRELHEPGGATRWKCRGCAGTWGFLDEVEDGPPCPALAFLFDGVGCG